jgi:hypothetical protein
MKCPMRSFYSTAIRKLVAMNEVDPQNEVLVYILDYMDQVCEGLLLNLEYKVIEPGDVEGLSTGPMAEPECLKFLRQFGLYRDGAEESFTQARNVSPSDIQNCGRNGFL